LRVQVGLRPLLEALGRDETLLDEIEARRRHRPVGLRRPIGRHARWREGWAQYLCVAATPVYVVDQVARPGARPIGRRSPTGR